VKKAKLVYFWQTASKKAKWQPWSKLLLYSIFQKTTTFYGQFRDESVLQTQLMMTLSGREDDSAEFFYKFYFKNCIYRSILPS
jgi:hypothetical protein